MKQCSRLRRLGPEQVHTNKVSSNATPSCITTSTLLFLYHTYVYPPSSKY